jgi:hypothetical protein
MILRAAQAVQDWTSTGASGCEFIGHRYRFSASDSIAKSTTCEKCSLETEVLRLEGLGASRRSGNLDADIVVYRITSFRLQPRYRSVVWTEAWPTRN